MKKASNEPVIVPRIHELIRDRREQLGLRQTDLAAAVGIGTGEGIGMIEKGVRRPDFNRIPRFADALRLDPKEFTKLALMEYYPECYATLYHSSPQLPAETTGKSQAAVDVQSAVRFYTRINRLTRNQRVTVDNLLDSLVQAASSR